MTVIGETWEDKYNALLVRLEVSNELVQDLNSQLEKANTEDWSPRVQVYKDKLKASEGELEIAYNMVSAGVEMLVTAEARIKELEELVREVSVVRIVTRDHTDSTRARIDGEVTYSASVPPLWVERAKKLLGIK